MRELKTISIDQYLHFNLARASLTIVGCFEWEALLQRYIHVQFKQYKIKQKQFRTKGKGGKWKVVDRGKVLNNREEKKKKGS